MSRSLFPRQRPERHLVAHIDGGARGNPGPAGYGVVIEDESGAAVAQFSEFLGVRTNNVAEYSGLIAALAYAVAHQHDALRVLSDSELLVKQMLGQYKVKSPDLKDLHARAREFTRQLQWFEIAHVRREQNRDADRLANEAMDAGSATAGPVRADAYAQKPVPAEKKVREVNGVVKNGVVEFLGKPLPDGTKVRIRKG